MAEAKMKKCSECKEILSQIHDSYYCPQCKLTYDEDDLRIIDEHEWCGHPECTICYPRKPKDKKVYVEIPGLTNEIMFKSHKQSWETLKQAIDSALEQGGEIGNIDLTTNNIDVSNAKMTIRLHLIRGKQNDI